MNVSCALITRNEIAGLRLLYERIPRHLLFELFAIDAQSTDGTVEFLQENGVPVHPQMERGYGAAMLEARVHTKGDALIYFHPDGNEDPAEISRFVERLEKGANFVVASRMVAGAWNEEDAKLLRWRKWANQGLALMANFLFSRNGVRTTDITNGLRAITCETFDRMCLTAKDLTLDFQMVIRALKLGLTIEEFATREGPRVDGQTNFASLPTGLKELGLIWQELLAGDAVFRGAGEVK